MQHRAGTALHLQHTSPLPHLHNDDGGLVRVDLPGSTTHAPHSTHCILQQICSHTQYDRRSAHEVQGTTLGAYSKMFFRRCIQFKTPADLVGNRVSVALDWAMTR